MMQHRHTNSKHLRQRHASDSLRLHPFDKSASASGSPYNSPSLDKEDADFFSDASTSANNTPRTPRTTDSTTTTPPPTTKPLRPKIVIQDEQTSQTEKHDSALTDSAIPPQHAATLSPWSSSQHLPEGAGTPHPDADDHVVTFPPPPPTWLNMPNKGQLAILCLSRFVDFFQMAAIQTYMVHQLKSFDPELPDSAISHQAGLLQGAFTAAQIITSILWGRAADQPGVGRKLVLNIGLIGTGLGCIGVGFSSNFHQAVVWRMLSGAINGTVGAARTMVAECVDKRYHPRAFLLLPAAFNLANVLGPILSGLLSDPVTAYPHLFGPNSTFGGSSGVKWMEKYPYALCNLLPTALLWAEALLCTLFLKETLKGFRNVEISNFDPVRLVKAAIASVRGVKEKGYSLVNSNAMSQRGLLTHTQDESREGSIELDRLATDGRSQNRAPSVLPFSKIWTSNVCWTLLSIAVFDFHMGAFSTLWILFLSAAREYNPDAADQEGPHKAMARSAFKFTGGLAFPPQTIGFAMAIIGFIGIILQFVLYPRANARYGLMRCFRGSLFFFPLAYFLAPYISLLPSSSESPNPASGFWVWLGIAFVIFLQVAARTFALPASIILLNNSSPHPSVLATIHGLGQADSATFRTIGPIVSSYWFGTWLERGVVGMAWWYVAAISALGAAASFKVRNGSGHEILLPGEEERADDMPPLGQRGRPMTPTDAERESDEFEKQETGLLSVKTPS